MTSLFREDTAAKEDEDDYMTMTFTEAPAAPETSLQRQQRLRREAEQRGRTKSKGELAAEEESRREAALSRSLLEDALAKKSKGLAMMAKMGFKGGALGSSPFSSSSDPAVRTKSGPRGDKSESVNDNGYAAKVGMDVAAKEDNRLVEPLRADMREGREGIGVESERKRKLREAVNQAGEVAKRAKTDEGDYRERVRREREEVRLGKLVHAAQKVAERMDEERTEAATEVEDKGDTDASQTTIKKDTSGVSFVSRPLKAVPVVWRGLVRARAAAERDRLMRHELEHGIVSSRLPTYEDDDGELDTDDRLALGLGSPGGAGVGADRDQTKRSIYVARDDLDEEDEDLEEFEALDPVRKLERLVAYLRIEHRYCFWCKAAYPDEVMDGCPGPLEEDHD